MTLVMQMYMLHVILQPWEFYILLNLCLQRNLESSEPKCALRPQKKDRMEGKKNSKQTLSHSLDTPLMFLLLLERYFGTIMP